MLYCTHKPDPFQAALTKDIKNELDATLGTLSGKGKGAKGKGPRGAERKKMWEDVRALRKESPVHFLFEDGL